jgi:hypothetical protein
MCKKPFLGGLSFRSTWYKHDIHICMLRLTIRHATGVQWRLVQRKMNSFHMRTHRYFVSRPLSDTLIARQSDWTQLVVFVSKHTEPVASLCVTVDTDSTVTEKGRNLANWNRIPERKRLAPECTELSHALRRLWWWLQMTGSDSDMCSAPCHFLYWFQII